MACPIFPHDVQTFTDDPMAKLGQIFERGDGTVWQYVQFLDGSGDITFASGDFCAWTDRDGYVVTADVTDGGDNPAGAIAATKRLDDEGNAATDKVPTDTQYGFIQIAGLHPAVNKPAGVDSPTIAEDLLAILHSADGEVTNAAAADPALAELNKMVGRFAGAPEDTATGTYREDTVPLNIKIAI